MRNDSFAVIIKCVSIFDMQTAPALNEYAFIPYDAIAEVKVKNYSFANKKVQTVKIKLDDKHVLHLLARKQEKLLPYQQENYAKIMSQYGKK